MTYVEFHLVFILSPLIALLAIQPTLWQRGERYRLVWVMVVATIAFVYTTPWDNYLVARGVWSYGTDRVIGTVGYVPIEEYAFFLLQPCLTGLWTLWLLPRMSANRSVPRGLGVRIAGAVCFAFVTVVGVVALRYESLTYAALILSWAGLALAGQWLVAGQKLWQRRRLMAAAIGVPTVYLWIADWVAIQDGIWSISATYTTGFNIVGLPIEEALFFLVTNVLVVQGLLLFLPDRAHGPVKSSKRRVRNAVTHALWG